MVNRLQHSTARRVPHYPETRRARSEVLALRGQDGGPNSPEWGRRGVHKAFSLYNKKKNGVEIIGDASSPGASKRFDLRSNEVFDRFLLLDFASSSRFWTGNVLTSSSSRGSSFIARMLELSTIFCSDSMIGLKWLLVAIVFFDLVGLQKAMFFMDRLGRFFNLSHNLLTLAYIFVIIHVDVLSTMEYWYRLTAPRYRKLVKSFSVSSVSKRTVLVYHQESILLLPTIAA